jgi:hypothetical protein
MKQLPTECSQNHENDGIHLNNVEHYIGGGDHRVHATDQENLQDNLIKCVIMSKLIKL